MNLDFSKVIPEKLPRQNYWLTRSEVKDMVRAPLYLKCVNGFSRVTIGVPVGTQQSNRIHLDWRPETNEA